ncbi:MAG: hypothetical protein V1820_05525, partial [archaeon]
MAGEFTEETIEGITYIRAPNGALFFSVASAKTWGYVLESADAEGLLVTARKLKTNYQNTYVEEGDERFANPGTRLLAEGNLALQLEFYQALLGERLGEYDGTPTDASRLEVENLTENTGFVDIGLAKKPALIDRGFATGVRYR